jgi:hypothetical protein
MTFSELYSLTPRSFFNAVNGSRKKEDAISKEKWLMTRKMMYWAIKPHLQNNETEIEFFPFNWEKKQIEKIKAAKILAVADDLKKMNEYWERQDAHSKINTTE